MDPQEETFWNTPGAAPRILNFNDDLLTDEQIDIGDLSVLESPVPEQASRAAPRRGLAQMRAGPSRKGALQFTQKMHEEESVENVSDTANLRGARAKAPVKEAEDEDSDDDRTVMLDDPPNLSSHSAQLESPPPAPREPDSSPSAETKEADLSRAPDTEPGKKRIKVTMDVERIASKVWGTVGDIVMPGHAYDLSGSGSGPKPPRAKETMSVLLVLVLKTSHSVFHSAYLKTLASQMPSLSSPSASSISFSTLSTVQAQSDRPTPQQVLTAQMLLALLDAAPLYALPLNKLKGILSTNGATTATNPIYKCVAKRLLKIERDGREQIVRFDS